MLCVHVYCRVTPGRNVYAEYGGQRPSSCPGGRPGPRRGAGLWANPGRGARAEEKRGEATWERREERGGMRTGVKIKGFVYLLCPALIGLNLMLMKSLDPPFELKNKIIIFLLFLMNCHRGFKMYDCVKSKFDILSSHQFQFKSLETC